jgi:heptosyltransferase-2
VDVDAQAVEACRARSSLEPISSKRLNHSFNKILVVQTAFLGDVVLTLPLIQCIKKNYPEASIEVVVVPAAANLLENHPAVSAILAFDKRGTDKGMKGFLRLRKRLAANQYDVAFVPHRSLRSALLARLADIPVRIGFDRSSGSHFFNHIVRYRAELHEIERNLSLLDPFGAARLGRELPSIYPSSSDCATIDQLLHECRIGETKGVIAIAPGTIWNTKRWIKERFAEVGKTMSGRGYAVALIGSREDRELCEEIRQLSGGTNVVNSAGMLTLRQSAELIRRSRVLLSNDSAPMHIAVAVRTPVIAIFGATVPEFGFGPYGERDVVVQTTPLACRPCSIHGTKECPIKTFDCMNNITVEKVIQTIAKFD